MAGAPAGLAGVRYGLPPHHVRGWSRLALAWLQFHPQDLKDNPRPELENLLRYLKVEIDQGRMDCIEAHLEGKFHRGEKKDQEDQGVDGDQSDPFTEELHKLLDKTILAADSFLRNKTGRSLPVDKYQYFTKL